MKILIYANSRSPFARDWVRLVSSFEGFEVLFVCSTSGTVVMGGDTSSVGVTKANLTSKAVGIAANLRKIFLAKLQSNILEKILDTVKLASVDRSARSLSYIQAKFQPQLLHAMRIPFEGIIANHADRSCPLVLSIWGNDLTFHAASGGRKASEIKLAIDNSTAIHADAQRDIDTLKREYQYGEERPLLVVPASGGLREQNIRLDISKREAKQILGYDPDCRIICNPRGLRPYIKTGVFAKASEKLLGANPTAVFISVGTGKTLAGWGCSEDGSNSSGRLISTRPLDVDQFRLVLRAADIIVSPSTHDGLPISVIEGLASGAFPVLSRLDSLAACIESPSQGRFFDLDGKGESLYETLECVLNNVNLGTASQVNQRLAFSKFASLNCEPMIREFYEQALACGRSSEAKVS